MLNLFYVLISLISHTSSHHIGVVLKLLVMFYLFFNILNLCTILPFDGIPSMSQQIYQLLIIKYQINSCCINIFKSQFLCYIFLEKGTSRYLRLFLHLLPILLVEFISVSSCHIHIQGIVTCRQVQFSILLPHFESFNSIEDQHYKN